MAGPGDFADAMPRLEVHPDHGERLLPSVELLNKPVTNDPLPAKRPSDKHKYLSRISGYRYRLQFRLFSILNQ
jgi:hypothetical protein